MNQENNDYPLHKAILEKNEIMIQYLIQNNPTLINQQNEDGNTPLHLSVNEDN